MDLEDCIVSIGRATYSPEDNKLRFYPDHRLDAEDYATIKAAGFKWAPKQELFVAPAWSPEREDVLLGFTDGQIDDEDTSLVDRAEQRADRLETLSEKRLNEAEQVKSTVDGIANNIPFGQPILVGHHSEKRARKDAERIQNGMRKAVNLWKTSQYWADRAAGALANAKYKERADVRHRRIKGLEADLRRCQKSVDESRKGIAAWSTPDLSLEAALHIANYNSVSACFKLADYPRDLPASQYEGPMSLWSALKDGVCTAAQAAERALKAHFASAERLQRWVDHLQNRIAYEKAMLAEHGDIPAATTGPEKGGAVRCWASPGYAKGWAYIKKVNKVSVTIEDNWGNGGKNFTRTIPFDKLKALMTKSQVDAARIEGRIHDIPTGEGFYLDEPAETRSEAKDRTHHEAVARAEEKKRDAAFEKLEQAAKTGVQVVCADQLFPTPAELADRVIDAAGISEGCRVLEPSAGTGSLISAIGRSVDNVEIVAVEINSRVASVLKSSTSADVRNTDFLGCNGDLGLFDRIVMNPPFSNGSDIQHILHARKFLKPGGRIVAICANGPRQRDNLMPIVEMTGGLWEDLPAGSFAEQGTNVNVAMITIEN